MKRYIIVIAILLNWPFNESIKKITDNTWFPKIRVGKFIVLGQLHKFLFLCYQTPMQYRMMSGFPQQQLRHAIADTYKESSDQYSNIFQIFDNAPIFMNTVCLKIELRNTVQELVVWGCLITALFANVDLKILLNI